MAGAKRVDGSAYTREELRAECVALVEPSADCRNACLNAFDNAVGVIRLMGQFDLEWTSPGRVRDEAKAFLAALATVSDQMQRLSAPARQLIFRGLPGYLEGVDPEVRRSLEAVDPDTFAAVDAVPTFAFDTFAACLSRLSEIAERVAKVAVPLHNAKASSQAKDAAARNARNVLKKYSNHHPTTKTEGPYFALAALMFEAATGVRDADMTRACRKVLREKRAHRPKAKAVRP